MGLSLVDPAFVTTPTDSLWNRAGAYPTLDLPFSRNKSLTDAVSGQNLITFTRASSGTYVDSQGVIRNATTNLMLRSEEFQTTWTALAASVSANSITAPNGALTADSLIEDATNASHVVFQSLLVVSALSYTASVYAKKGTRAWVQVAFQSTCFGSNAWANFNLDTGVVGSVGTSATAAIQNVGDGWYRCSVTATATLTGGTGGFAIGLLDQDANLRLPSYQGDGSSLIYIWGAQQEQSDTVGEYIPTTSTINSAPRFDHNPTTGESLGLLVEEQRTNSIRNNTMVGAVAGTPGTLPTYWTRFGAGSITEIIGTGIEDGITYIDVRFSGTVTNANLNFDTGIAATASQVWSGSVYLKLLSGSIAGTWRMCANEFDSGNTYLRTGLVVNIAPTAASLATQRLTGSFTIGASTATLHFLLNGLGSGQAVDFTLRIGMPQLEQGAFATSVIPTTTSAATRAADVASITGGNFSSWYQQDEGTNLMIFSEYAARTDIRTPRSLNDGTSSNRIDGFLSANYNHRLVVSDGFFTSSALSYAASPSINSHAQSAQTNSAVACLNGALSSTVSPTSMPVINRFDIGRDSVGGTPFSGHIRRLTHWPARLPNATLQAITL